MKKMIIAILVLLSTAAIASLPQITIKNLSGQMNGPYLTATADQFFLAKGERMEVSLYPYEQGLMLKYGNQEKFLTTSPSELESVENISFTNISMNAKANNIKVSASALSMEGNFLSGLNLECSGGTSVGDILEQVLHSCTTTSSAKISKMVVDAKSTWLEFFASVLDIKIDDTKSMELGDVDLSNKDHKYKLKVKAKLGSIKVTATLYGKLEYQPTSKRVQVKIDSAWAVFIPITGKLFDELEKMASAKFVVQKPYLYIYL